MSVSVQEDNFDVGAELKVLNADKRDIGAVVSFTGVVRDTDGNLEALELEHYPGMTVKALDAIEKEAVSRWSLKGCRIIHRYGRLEPGDQIMMVATASAHRAAAFEAADFLMDYLKSRAPFWKKEHRKDGSDWVDAKETDEQALDRWSK